MAFQAYTTLQEGTKGVCRQSHAQPAHSLPAPAAAVRPLLRARPRRCCGPRPTQRRRSAVMQAAAAAEYVAEVPVAGQQATWYALVANAEFMLHDVQNEALAEQLRERKRLFSEQSRKLDFFLVSEPAWLDAKFPREAAKVRRPCVALVSTDKIWITFMKLRLDRVLKLDLGRVTPEEVLASGAPVPEFPPLDRGTWTAPYPPYRPGWWKAFEPDAFA